VAAPTWAEIIPVYVTTADLSAEHLAELYVVPSGSGVLTIGPVIGRDGNPVQSFDAYAYNGYSTWGRSTGTGSVSVIQPAQTTYVEMSTWDSPPLFLNAQTAIVAGQRQVVTLDARNAVHLQVFAEVGGAALSGGVALHNEAMADYSSWAGSTLSPDLYVTPGTYSVQFRSDPAPDPILLQESGIALTADTTRWFSYSPAELAGLQIVGQDGQGNARMPDNIRLETPGLRSTLSGTHFLASARGTQYRLFGYRFFMYATSTDEWDMDFWGERPFFTPDKGTGYTWTVGGPVQQKVSYRSGCLQAGCTVTFNTGVYTADHDRLQMFNANGARRTGNLGIVDPQGNTVASQTTTSGYWQESITLPQPLPAGQYTANLTYDFGPYQPSATGAYQFQAGSTAAPALHLDLSSDQAGPRVHGKPTWITDGCTAAGCSCEF
jgi:hypothetical protein